MHGPVSSPVYFTEDDCPVSILTALCDRRTTRDDVPHAEDIVHRVPVYDASALDGVLGVPDLRRDLMAEWAAVLRDGAGIVVLRGAVPDLAALDDATAAYTAMIADEAARGAGGGDHFATPGTNARVWNSAQKLCLAAPETFARVFGSPVLDAVCEAWLGPFYQMTAQVNLVRPGGTAQVPHRDYHLGFLGADDSARFPLHVHTLSPLLTLQGAIAHVDMDIESGPTKLLPFSQTHPQGYAAVRRENHRAYFEAHHVQVPLKKGDALFFNPAVFHAAGDNRTADVHRMANLLQVSSAFGRALEALDRTAMCKALYPALRRLQPRLGPERTRAALAACAEGYAFPTSLDTDPPVGGLAPEAQATLMARALAEGWEDEAVHAALDAMAERKRP